MVNFGERLRQLRSTANCTQREVAEAIDATRVTVARWERGEVVPHAGTQRRLADFFGVSIAQLNGDDAISDEGLQQAAARVARKLGRPGADSREKTKIDPSVLSDDDLMREVAKRYRLTAIEAERVLSAARNIDPAEVAEALLETPVSSPLPPKLENQLRLMESAGHALQKTIDRYLPSRWVEQHHAELPDGEQHDFKLDADSMMERWKDLQDRFSGSQLVIHEYMTLREIAQKHPELGTMIEGTRSSKELEKLADPVVRLNIVVRAVFDTLGEANRIKHRSSPDRGTQEKKSSK